MYPTVTKILSASCGDIRSDVGVPHCNKNTFCFSGTEKQVVTYDYEERLANGIMEGQVWLFY